MVPEPQPEAESLLPGLSRLAREALRPTSLLLLGATAAVMFVHYPLQHVLPPTQRPMEWAGTGVVVFLLIPVVVLWASGRGTRAYGLRVGAAREWIPLILLGLVVMVPVIAVFSKRPEFRLYYPIYLPARRGGDALVQWELMYGAYFFAWEFLFRGLLLFGLAGRYGPQAIVLQTVPFALAHLGKPAPEAFASILAGFLLGLIAYRSRSMLPCFILHWAWALAMDLAVVFTSRSLVMASGVCSWWS